MRRAESDRPPRAQHGDRDLESMFLGVAEGGRSLARRGSAREGRDERQQRARVRRWSVAPAVDRSGAPRRRSARPLRKLTRRARAPTRGTSSTSCRRRRSDGRGCRATGTGPTRSRAARANHVDTTSSRRRATRTGSTRSPARIRRVDTASCRGKPSSNGDRLDAIPGHELAFESTPLHVAARRRTAGAGWRANLSPRRARRGRR